MRGVRVDLVPADTRPEAHMSFNALRNSLPELGGHYNHDLQPAGYAPRMLIWSKVQDGPVGLVYSMELADAPGVVESFILSNRRVSRPAHVLEGALLYAQAIFAQGADKLIWSVSEFNLPVLRMLARSGITLQVRLRQEAYVAGRFWDVLVFGTTRDEWLELLSRFMERLPGGTPTPDAFREGMKSDRAQP